MKRSIHYITYARMPTEKAHGLQIIQMCRAFAEAGHQVTLAVPRRYTKITASVFEYYGVPEVFSLRYIKVPDFSFWFRYLGSLAFKIHVTLFAFCSCYLAVPKDHIIVTRTPVVAWLYGWRGYTVLCEVHDWPPSRISRCALKFFLRRVTGVVCNSEGTARLFGQSRVPVLVAHNGVALADFSVVVDVQTERKKRNIPDDLPVLMYIGALETWKGIDTLGETACLLEGIVRVVVIGGSAKEVAQYQARFPEVLFLGSRPFPELPVNQKLADILVVPNSGHDEQSVARTSPIKLFAHLLSLKPVVVSDLPSLRSIVSEREVYWFQPDEAESLAQVVREALVSPKESAEKVKAAQIVGAKFTWSARAEQMIRLCDSSL